MTPAPNTLLVVASLLVGWVTLWPLRHHLRWTVHLVAVPVGLLAWALAVGVSTVAGTPLTHVCAVGGIALLVLLTSGLGNLYAQQDPARGSRLGWWSYPLVGVVVTALAERITRAGVYVVSADSWSNYEPMGWLLRDTGGLTRLILNERNILMPSMHAIGRGLGTEVTFTIYQVLAILLALLVARLVWTSLDSLALRWRLPLAAAPAVLLVSSPVWAFMSMYVHSHIITATYLLMAIAGIDEARHTPRHARDPWLLVAGLGSAGLALSRPDGLAYVFVPVLAYLGAHLHHGWQRRETVAFFAPFLGIVWLAFGAAFVRLGLWAPPKLSGAVALGALLALSASAAVPALMRYAGAAGRWLAAKQRFPVAVLGATGAAVLAVVALRPESATRAISNMAVNLFSAPGGWGGFWYATAAALLAAALTRAVTGPEDWRDALGLAVAQFFALALLVHAAAHPGRLYWGDSFNRVAFHVVPLVFWYVAVSAGGLVAAGKSDAAGPEERRVTAA